jgi:putative PIN family toxin of toxin-antitoxin system
LPADPLRLVLATNVLLAGLVSKSSASQKVVDSLASRKTIPLVSPPVLAEYRAVLLHPEIAKRFGNLTARRVELALHRLRYVGDEFDTTRVRFELARDPRDAMFVELAIVGQATHLITMDGDLLSLPTNPHRCGKTLPTTPPAAHRANPAILHRTAWTNPGLLATTMR